MNSSKLVVAIYSFGSCEGCRHEILNLGETLLELIKDYHVMIVHEPLLGYLGEMEEYDVVLIEGSITLEKEVKKLVELRSKSKTLVALGSCSLLGGIPALMKDLKEDVTRTLTNTQVSKLVKVLPISNYVKVDYWLRGCPINRFEFLTLIKKLSEGKYFKQGERRFNFCRTSTTNIKGKLLTLDGEKCIVCGRCVGICSNLGVNALGLINRGIDIAVSTPFQEVFDNTYCISCGLCAAYCPVSAVNYVSTTQLVQDMLKSNEKLTAYIEYDSLAALAEAEGVHPGRLITAIKKLGFDKVVLWTPLAEVRPSTDLNIVPMSYAEYRYLTQFYPDIKKYLTQPPAMRIPYKTVLITQCVSRKMYGDYVLTTREVQTMIKPLDLTELEPIDPDYVFKSNVYGYLKAVGPYELRGVLEAVRKGIIRTGIIVTYICPNGCLMGGGQPYSRLPFEVCVECRENYYNKILKTYLTL